MSERNKLRVVVNSWQDKVAKLDALKLPSARPERVFSIDEQELKPANSYVVQDDGETSVRWIHEALPSPVILEISYRSGANPWFSGGRLKLLLAVLVLVQTVASAGGSALANLMSRSAKEELDAYRTLATAFASQGAAQADPVCSHQSVLSPTCLGKAIDGLRTSLASEKARADQGSKKVVVAEDQLAQERAIIQSVENALRIKGKRGCGGPDTSLQSCAEDYANDWRRMAGALDCKQEAAKELFDCLEGKLPK